MDPKIKNIAMFILMGIGCFFFFLYFVNLEWYYALGVTLLYMYMLFRSFQRKEKILAEGEDEIK